MNDSLSQGNVLIVEDNPNTRQMLADLLTNAGYQAFVAMNGEDAIERAATLLPDVILLEMMLPGIDGYEVCRRLKEQQATAVLPVIFLSALTEKFDIIKGFELGAADYLANPITAEELLVRVRNQVTIHQLRRDIEDANRLLEVRVAERTAELEACVAQRTAELHAAQKELQRFAYIVSHDLKEPLRGVHQLSQWLVHDYGSVIDEEGKEMFAMMTHQVKRLINLIDGVLQYSRAGQKMHDETPVNLAALIPEIVESLTPPQTIQITYSPDLPTFLADQTRIRQVFQHLIENAIKFMDKPQGEISIQCRDEGACWQFSVTDNGPGIEARHYERIFHIFRTLRSCDDADSVGVGLAIVKKIVELYGGRVWVESKIGQGSSFYLTFPKHALVEDSK